MLEIDQQANLSSRDFWVVQHLPDFMISDLLDRFGVDNDLIKADWIRVVFP